MKNFKKQYRDLELEVMNELINMIRNSNYISKHLDEKAIKVNISNYDELCIVNDKLTFIDNRGLHYSLYCDVTLEDLIYILLNNN